ALIAAVALLWFDIPFRGNVLALLLAAFVYIVASLGIGLLISTISRTQQEAFMGMFLMLLPAIILSGFMYPIENMAAFFRWVTLLNPIRHYLVVVRGIFLKGAGWDALWPQIVTLAAMGTVVLWFATTRFHKTTS
ncbi:MAG: ABC transporter permease, partial [Gemmatimonadetes bacterium]|nr:ABC transporter permease [Gemmatimonadota bacterium]